MFVIKMYSCYSRYNLHILHAPFISVSERCMQQYGLKNICAREGTQSVFSCLSNDDVTWTWHPVNGTETAILDQDQFKYLF